MIGPLALLAAQAASPLAGFELIHNAPEGTSLTTPDLRELAPVWCAMLKDARQTADFEQFYVAGKSGEPLDRVIGCMEEAARRGVKIRFLMEGQGVKMSDEPTLGRLRAIPHLDFRILNFAQVSGSGIIHAKFFVVDGRSAYVGSQNFDWRSLSEIDETGVKIDDPHAVSQLAAIFAHDWAAQATLAAGGTVAPTNKGEVAANDNGAATLVASPNAFNPAGVGDSQAELVRLIGQSAQEVRITVMTYAPLSFGGGYYPVIDNALRAAAERGVKIKLLVADWNLTPKKTPWLTSLAAIPNVEIRVATIPEAKEGPIPFARVIHTKTMAIDGKIAWVGTSNWEGGYFDTSRNIELVFRDAAMADRIGRMHETLWSSPYAQPLEVAVRAKQVSAVP
ncbi:Phosphatidylserine/phosphatidylglycerophosphate/cardiolipin synthase [Sphingobium sp. AP50]|uniref:phospholipase D-like domain-containing protein n=1 Tax=Sphingobium sp. AP50 TaxID=1884369 RepID=UPI0008BD51AA|nr:phospholipase D-like domain-containing protein [Sphingobium sp. AP50]SEK06742.1 Phosphatidylserine/phosphatidylglycerophosphate/cardiolipin synthase [Sphingobium sp. AP50]